jgi:hypothetical protein
MHRLTETAAANEPILETARKEYHLKSRDHARTPVQVGRLPVPFKRIADHFSGIQVLMQVSQLVAPGSE